MKSKLFVAILLVVLLVACDVNKTFITLSVTSTKLAIGATKELIVTGEVRENLEWYSSDDSIATVDNLGVVRPVKPGIVMITCTSVTGTSSLGSSDTIKLYVGYRETFDAVGHWDVGSFTGEGDVIIGDSEISDGVLNVTLTNSGGSTRGAFTMYSEVIDGSDNVVFNQPYNLAFDSIFTSATDDSYTTIYLKFNYIEDFNNEEWSFDCLAINSNKSVTITHNNSIDGWSGSPEHPNYLNWTAGYSSAINGLGDAANKIVIEQGHSSFTVSINGVLLGSYVNKKTPFVYPHFFHFGNWQSYAESPEMFTIETAYDNIEIYPID